jgi:CHAT domain-containing protein
LVAQDRLAEAEDVARNALASLGGGSSGQAAATLGMLGTILSKRQGPNQAEPYLRRSLAMWESVSGARSRKVLDARFDLGDNLFAQRRLAEAEAIYRRALTDMRQSWGDNGRQTLDVQEFAGFLAELQGKFVDAVRDYRAVCATRAEQTAQSGRGARASLVKTPDTDRAGGCSLHEAILLRHWALAGGGTAPQDQPFALRDEAFAAAQRALPSPSGEAMARAAARQAAALATPDDLAERYEALIQKRDAAGFAPKPIPQDYFADAPLTAERQAEKDKLGDEIARIATRLSTVAPLYWDIRMPRALDIAALQHLLHKDEALIYFMVAPGDVHGLAFAVARDRAGWATLGKTGAELKLEVTGLRGDIDTGAYGVGEDVRAQGPGYAPFDRKKAYGLYLALFGDPEIQAVMAGHHTLIIVPSGPLIALPPGLLVTKAPHGDGASDADTMRHTDWLLREKAIAVLPSVAALRIVRELVARHRHGLSDPLLAFTNPDFTGGATGDGGVSAATRGSPRNYTSYFRGGEPSVALLRTLPSLPHTRDEGMALAKALNAPSSAVLSGMEASRAELMKRNSDGRLARARVVEFATHGLVAGDGDGFAEPALVLSSGPSPRDWLLTASDAAQLRINADWVLLSACNTASPDLQDAEGLSGLARGFFYAGASALLVSHWSLADDTAATLVPTAIGLQADKGLSRAEALRRASLAILDELGADHTHPFYWAPFVLIGEPR